MGDEHHNRVSDSMLAELVHQVNSIASRMGEVSANQKRLMDDTAQLRVESHAEKADHANLYKKLDATDVSLTDLHERISVMNSDSHHADHSYIGVLRREAECKAKKAEAKMLFWQTVWQHTIKVGVARGLIFLVVVTGVVLWDSVVAALHDVWAFLQRLRDTR